MFSNSLHRRIKDRISPETVAKHAAAQLFIVSVFMLGWVAGARADKGPVTYDRVVNGWPYTLEWWFVMDVLEAWVVIAVITFTAAVLWRLLHDRYVSS
jgi:hypothetical protein